MKINSYLKNTMMFLMGLKIKKKISSDGWDYEKDYMEIKFNSDDNLSLKKPLKFCLITITIKSVFEEDSKLYLNLKFL